MLSFELISLENAYTAITHKTDKFRTKIIGCIVRSIFYRTLHIDLRILMTNFRKVFPCGAASDIFKRILM